MIRHKEFLFCVNRADQTISSLKILPEGQLEVVDVVSSQANIPPNVLSISDNFLVAGHRGSHFPSRRKNRLMITGYTVDEQGGIKPQPSANQYIKVKSLQLQDIGFNASESILLASGAERTKWYEGVILTEAIPVLYAYRYSASRLEEPLEKLDSYQLDASAQGFGFSWNKKYVYWTDTDGYVNSVSIEDEGIRLIERVLSGGKGTCWTALTSDKQYLYVTDFLVNKVTSFKVNDGKLVKSQALDIGGLTSDCVLSKDENFLYVLSAGSTRWRLLLNIITLGLVRMNTTSFINIIDIRDKENMVFVGKIELDTWSYGGLVCFDEEDIV